MAAVVTPTPTTLVRRSYLNRRNFSTGFIIGSSPAKLLGFPKQIYFACISKFEKIIDIFFTY